MWNQKLCDSSDKWLLRRRSEKDVVAQGDERKLALVELRGEVLLCIKDDVVASTFEGTGKVSFTAAANAVASSGGTADVEPDVYECPSPLVERVEYLKESKLPIDLEDEETAKQVFRFDDPSTALPDDFSLGPCECAVETYGESFPMHSSVSEVIPPGSGNMFVPPPQLISSGSVACEPRFLIETRRGMNAEDCNLEAMKAKVRYYWSGELTGIEVCRFYSNCEHLSVEHFSDGVLYALSFEPVCAIANPEQCWAMEKRRAFLSGYKSRVLPGAGWSDEACLFEPALRACDRLRASRLGSGIGECGRCQYKSSHLISGRLPLPSAFLCASQIVVSCNPDRWRGLSRENGQPLRGKLLTCVDGRWKDEGGMNSMVQFTCESGVRITDNAKTSLLLAQGAGKEVSWWEGHFGKVIKNFDGTCLAPDHNLHSIDISANLGLSSVTVFFDATNEFAHLSARGTIEFYRPGSRFVRSETWGICGADCVLITNTKFFTLDFGKAFSAAGSGAFFLAAHGCGRWLVV